MLIYTHPDRDTHWGRMLREGRAQTRTEQEGLGSAGSSVAPSRMGRLPAGADCWNGHISAPSFALHLSFKRQDPP